MSEIEELARLAKAATPGPWKENPDDPVTGYADIDNVISGADGCDIASIYGGRELQPQRTNLPLFEQCRANAAFIAAANPERILALLAERDALKKEVSVVTEAATSGLALIKAELARAKDTFKVLEAINVELKSQLSQAEARGIERAIKVIADYGQEGDQLSKEYACEMADELLARLRALKPESTHNG